MHAWTRRQFHQFSGALTLAALTGPAGASGGSGGIPPAQGRVSFPDGRTVPALGQGSWHLAQGRHPVPAEIQALRTGLDLGLTLIDTAEMYGNGNAEELIGHAITGRRERVFLVSKVLPSHASAAGIPRACDASLARLGTDHLDLYLLHWRGGADLAEVVPAFEALRRSGKIKAWGVSNFDVADMEALFRVPGGEHCATNQVLYNVASRGIEFDLMPWCAARHMPIMAYSPLGSSTLLHHPALARLGTAHKVAPTAIALAWAMRSGRVVAIPESGSAEHVRENAAALSLKLTPDDLRVLDAVFPPPSRKVPLEMI